MNTITELLAELADIEVAAQSLGERKLAAFKRIYELTPDNSWEDCVATFICDNCIITVVKHKHGPAVTVRHAPTAL